MWTLLNYSLCITSSTLLPRPIVKYYVALADSSRACKRHDNRRLRSARQLAAATRMFSQSDPPNLGYTRPMYHLRVPTRKVCHMSNVGFRKIEHSTYGNIWYHLRVPNLIKRTKVECSIFLNRTFDIWQNF